MQNEFKYEMHRHSHNLSNNNRLPVDINRATRSHNQPEVFDENLSNTDTVHRILKVNTNQLTEEEVAKDKARFLRLLIEE